MVEEICFKICEIENQIVALKAKLNMTDYKILKYYEGELSASEYAEVVAQRKEWRTKINTLEEELKKYENL